MPSRPIAPSPRRGSVPAALLLAVAALVLSARAIRAEDPPPADDPIVTLHITDDMPVQDLLRGLGRALPDENGVPLPILWQSDDKAITTKKLTPAATIRAPRSKLLDTVRAILTFEEIVLIPIGPPRYVIYVAMDARALASQFIFRNKPLYVEMTDANVRDYENQDGLFVATTIKVQNMDNLRDARQALQRLITQNNIGSVQEVPAARAFVVADFAPNVAAIYRLIREMDVQPTGKKLKQVFVPLKHALAEDIEPILVDLFTGNTRLSQVQPGGQPGGDIVDPEPRMRSDPRSNQLIVYATEDDVREILLLIEHLDTPLVYTNQFLNVVRLKNLEAEPTAQVLTELIEGTTLFGTGGGGTFSSSSSSRRTGSGSSTRTTGSTARTGPVPAGVVQSPEYAEKPTVVADEASNSLIIAASPEQYKQIKGVIDTIDIRKRQVLIEAALVELSLDDSFRFAVELGLLDDNGLKQRGGPSGFAGTSFGLTEYADVDGDGSFTDRLPPFITAGGAAPAGVIGGIFAAGQVPLIYRALNTVRRTRVLQLPSIVTADNEEATIRVLDEQAVTENTVTSGGNTSAGFGGFEEAGTTLSISPHIADDTYLLLNINLEVSGFLGEPQIVGSVQIPADKFRRNVITVVTLPDRHTVVLGGLIGSTQGSTVDQVPFLGEIPLLGNLFKGTSKSDVQTNLFLFVTPSILRADDDFAEFDRITCERKAKADELVGELEIPFSKFVGCPDRCFDPATGMLRGSGSASDRLDQAGFLDATHFRGVDPTRLAAEAQARRRAMIPAGAPAPAR
jgi:general secretion pathway protein D